MKIKKRKISQYTIIAFCATLFLMCGVSLFIPAPVLGIEECENLNIDLEISIGDTTQIDGLTEYVTVVYQFIVGTITIIAVIVLMYWGFRWITAAGNQTIIGSAKEGITSALIGLVIGLTSYAILFMLNTSFVTFPSICAQGVQFQNFGDEWETCQTRSSNNARDCTDVDYCDAARGCSCQPIQGSSTLYCLPLADQELAQGLRCRNSENCMEPLTCVGGAIDRAGLCTQSNVNADCTNNNSICTSPLRCLDANENGTIKRCMTQAGRHDGQYCEADNECASGVCVDQLHVCFSGEVGARCLVTGQTYQQCAWGNYCVSRACTDDAGQPFACCQEKAIDDLCDEDNGCPGTLHCVDNDGRARSSCQSGAAGAHCDNDTDCSVSAPYCVENDENFGSSCQTGAAGSSCDIDSECIGAACWGNECVEQGEHQHCTDDAECPADASHCVRNYCFNGSNLDYCRTGADCTSGTCSNNGRCYRD